jgi:hypothetical protein
VKRLLALILLACSALAASAAAEQAPVTRSGQPAKARPAAAGGAPASGPAWKEISPAQQQALRPLQKNWDGLDAQGKRRWLGVASRFQAMSPVERALVQQRMNEWARLSPKERNEARLNFRDVRELSPDNRRERWEAYQALPEDARRTFGARSNPEPASRRPARDNAKSNTVPNPLLEARRPGATTNPITTRPAPPLHQQPGLPKVAATPEFVNSLTLLPRRGAQAAATGGHDPAAASNP